MCAVLIQGLSSEHCWLAPLVLLCLVIEQAHDTALVRVKHSWPSLYMEFCLQTAMIWLLLWFKTHAFLCHNNSIRFNPQDEYNLEEIFLWV